MVAGSNPARGASSIARLLALLLVLIAWPAWSQSRVVTPHVTADLLAYAPDGIAPGKTLWLGLRLAHKPGWHSYWKNPGDTGLPTTLAWTLPPGLAAGAIEWPAPQRLPVPPLLNYGYEGDLLLPVPIRVAAAPARPFTVVLKAEWLVCATLCVPESGSFAITLSPAAPPVADRARFEAAWTARPTTIPEAHGGATVANGRLEVWLTGLPPTLTGRELALFPETQRLIDHAAPADVRWRGGVWTASLPLQPNPAALPDKLPVVIEASGATPPAIALSLARGAPAPAGGGGTGFVAALALALIGGVLLNLMPCVFPVLSLKLIGIVRHAGDRRALARSGLAYTAGTLVAVLALAGVLIAARAAGTALGWGFQLQSPGAIAALALLFFLIGLNLAGLFEVAMLLPGRLAAARARDPITDSFLTGLLAVAVASPCTAPFMGASLGLAATLPAPQALALFAALGLGIALPLLLASLVPGFARILPRPGAWMATFRTAMAFPMFATAIWLAWVLTRMSGADGVAALLTLMLAAAFAIWLWGLASGRRAAAVRIAAVALLLVAGWRLAPAITAPAAAAPAEAGWAPWSPAKVADAVAAKRPVLVDFTAAWCVTCQFNKRTVLASAEVIAALDRCHVERLEADWTNRDPAITAALAGFGRNGVPVYALYGAGAEPTLLGEVLTRSGVIAALGRLPGCGRS